MENVEKIMKKRKDITEKYQFLKPELTMTESMKKKQMKKSSLCQICSNYFDSGLCSNASESMCSTCFLNLRK